MGIATNANFAGKTINILNQCLQLQGGLALAGVGDQLYRRFQVFQVACQLLFHFQV